VNGRPRDPAGLPSVVVGAAIVRHGCVLAARRTTPPEAAGRWELPGGKVEAGETSDDALVREIGEELDCRIRVEGWLDGEAAIGDAHVLRVAVATMEHGSPVAGTLEGGHDELRWLTPEQLDDVDWLAPDRPFLPQLKEMLLDGERLLGGNIGGAVRIGDTVRRPTGRWTPSVHAFLMHLHAAGLRGVPRVHGYDERGREILDYLPGEVVDIDTELLSKPRLADFGRWTKEFHLAQVGFDDPGPWRYRGEVRHSITGHNDLAPYNACFEGERLVGVFDWDIAGPATVLMDLSVLAWGAVPLYRDVGRALTAHRLQVLADAYDGPLAADILRAVPDRMRQSVDGIRQSIEQGDKTMATLAALGEPERTERRLAELVDRIPTLVRALSTTS
jgi:8-oxo-dGTP diphosphatase